MNENRANQYRRHRGMVLQLVHTNRADQLSRMDDVEMWGLLRELNVEIGQNGVLTLLQDLRDRGYLKFDERANRFSGRTEISRIEVTGKGCDLVERTVADPAVLIP